MKKFKIFILTVLLFSLNIILINAENNFHLKSSGIKKGVISSIFGINGDYVKGGIPYYSLPLEICNPPKNTKSFAIVILDCDAIQPTGFTWIHWSVANLKSTSLKANASRADSSLIQGVNSWYSPLLKNPLNVKEASYYGGMAPPDKTHKYTITCYALDTVLPIKNGFFLNELYDKMEGHIISQTNITGLYPKQKN